MKINKFISLSLSLVLICTAGLMCGSTLQTKAITTPTIKENGNYIYNGNFESYKTAYYSYYGFEGKTVAHGKTSVIVDNWIGFNWKESYNNPVEISHTTDCYGGSYALKFDIPTNCQPLNLYMDEGPTLTAGTYRLTAKVKGDNTESTVRVQGSELYTATIKPTENWKEFVLDGIQISETGLGTIYVNSKAVPGIVFDIKKSSTATNLYIDNVRLEKIEENSNILPNASFEDPGSRIGGFAELNFGNGQLNECTNSWHGLTWVANKFKFYQTTDSYSGKYALSIYIPSTTGDNNNKELKLYPKWDTLNLDTQSTLPQGTYTMSICYKSNHTSSDNRFEILNGDNQFAALYLPSTNDAWQVKSVDFSVTAVNGLTLNSYKTNNINVNKSIRIYLKENGTIDGNIIIDDISIVPKHTINIAEAVSKIDGAIEVNRNDKTLSYPQVADNIKVSLKSSSDESVIDLEGAITPKLSRQFVDITYMLKNVDSTEDSAVTDTYTVIVPGSSDEKIDSAVRAIYAIPTQNFEVSQYPLFSKAQALFEFLSDDEKLCIPTDVIEIYGQRKASFEELNLVTSLVNGSFETGDLRGFENTNVIVENNAAVLTNGTLISQKFVLPAGIYTLKFDATNVADGFEYDVYAGQTAIGKTKAENTVIFSTDGNSEMIFKAQGSATIDNIIIEKNVVLGDVNGDGKINSSDIAAIRKHLLGVETISDIILADFNNNGEIDICDLVHLKVLATQSN